MIGNTNLYITLTNKPRCRSLTSNKTQCKNSAKHKCDKTGEFIYCGIHYNSMKKLESKQSKQSKTMRKYKNRVNPLIYSNTDLCNLIKIQSMWRRYKERLYKSVYNNGINSSNDTSILTLEPIRNLNDAFVYYVNIDGNKRWYMESIKGMYNWYMVYKKSQVNNNTSNMKCIYTNQELTTPEQEYIIRFFDKIKKYSSLKYLTTPIIVEEMKTLYERVLDKCHQLFTDSTDSVYIDTLMRLSDTSIYRYITECNKMLNDNSIYSVLKACRSVIDKIKYKKYCAKDLNILYQRGHIKLRKYSINVPSAYFILNKDKIEEEYKTLLMKEYLLDELIQKCNINDMLMYYIRSNNLWYYAITTLFFPDSPKNDVIVNEFDQLPMLNTYYNGLLIK